LLDSLLQEIYAHLKMIKDECIFISEWPPPECSECDEQSTSEEKPSCTSENKTGLKEANGFKFYPPKALSVLAQWLRKNSSKIKSDLSMSSSKCSPKTLLNLASQSKEGKLLLRQKLEMIHNEFDCEEGDAEMNFILASYHDYLGDVNLALKHVKMSLISLKLDLRLLEASVSEFLRSLKSLGDLEKDCLWLAAKCRLIEGQCSFKTIPSQKNVVILNYDDVSCENFKRRYCEMRTPVVFKSVPRLTRNKWTLEFIKEKAGRKVVDVKVPETISTEWAGLEKVGQKTVSDFLQDLQHHASQEYLFDWSLPLNAPELEADFHIPRLFNDNYLKKTSQSALYHDSWPSLFISNAGTNSGLHVDAFGSHFWMYLISGRKKWTFFSAEDCGSLNPKYYDSLDPIFSPDKKTLESLDSYNICLEEGDLLFVPGGSPHRVENIEKSVAVSGNFVNETNLEEAIWHFKVNAMKDSRYQDLLHEFLQKGFVK